MVNQLRGVLVVLLENPILPMVCCCAALTTCVLRRAISLKIQSHCDGMRVLRFDDMPSTNERACCYDVLRVPCPSKIQNLRLGYEYCDMVCSLQYEYVAEGRRAKMLGVR